MNHTTKITAAAMALSLLFTMGTAAASTGSSAVSSRVSSSAQSQRFDGRPKRARNCRLGMEALSKITGLTEDQLMEKYPQKTAWQIAYQLGKLSDLKKEVAANHKEMIDRLLQDKKITESEASKMTADFQKRLNAIDGKNTVILGRPGYRPNMGRGGRQAEEK